MNYLELRYDQLLALAAETFPFRPALVQNGWSLSYGSLDAWTNATANLLINRWGVRPGDVVAVSVALCIESCVAYQAVLRSGAIVTPINPLHNSPADMAYQLKHAGPRICIACPDTYAVLCELFDADRVIWYGSPDFEFPSSCNLIAAASAESFEAPRIPAVAPDAIAAIAYTSGTTDGTPKGVQLSHRNLVSNAMQFASAQCLSERDTMLNGQPLLVSMHMGGAIASGATMVLANRGRAQDLLDQARVAMATQMYVGAPVVMEMGEMSELHAWRTPWLKSITGAAAKLTPAVLAYVGKSLQVAVVQGYGLTEAAPFTHTHPVFHGYAAPAGSCGLPGPDTEQRIVDPECGTVLPRGRQHVGELHLRGPQVMAGYLGDDARTADVLRDGWLRTGDLASIDENGYLYYCDRLADVIRTDSRYVIPLELEFLMRSHPGVRDCAVVGVPLPGERQEVVAYVVPESGARIDEESLRGFVNGRVEAHQEIGRIVLVPSLPRSGIGKLLRRIVRGYAREAAATNT
jgi:long-chain acyl-CoA synthetase